MGKRQQRDTFAEVIERVRADADAVPCAEPELRSYATNEALHDENGQLWQRHRWLRRRDVERFLAGEDALARFALTEAGGVGEVRWLSRQEAQERWATQLSRRFDDEKLRGPVWPAEPVYDAVECVGPDNRRALLFITNC